MQQTQTKKLVKRFTPFSYKHTIADALSNTFERFRDSVIVLSYSSNAVPDRDTVAALLREVKGTVDVRPVEHRYSFGTHAAAKQPHRRRISLRRVLTCRPILLRPRGYTV